MRKAFTIYIILPLFASLFCQAAFGQDKVDSLKALLKTELSDSTRADILYTFSTFLFYSDPDSTLLLANQSKDLSERIGYQKGIGMALNVIAARYTTEGQQDAASIYYEEALAHFRSIGDTRWEGLILNNLGALSQSRALHSKALSYFQQCLELRLKNEDSTEVIETILGIGSTHSSISNYDLASKYYQIGLRLSKKKKDLSQIAASLIYIGNLYMKSSYNDSTKALEAHLESIEILDSLGQTCRTLESLIAVGILYKDMGNLKKSSEFLQLAYEKSLSCKSPRNTISALIYLGEIYALQVANKKAEKLLLEAYELTRENGFKQKEKQSTRSLYEFYRKIGKDSEAIVYLVKYLNLQTKLFNEKLKDEVIKKELSFQFQQEKDSIEAAKQQELLIANTQIEKQRIIQYATILGLLLALALAYVIYRYYLSSKKSAVVLQEKNTIITETLHEREVLLQEIHHRVKNNLQVVSSLLNVQSKYLNDELAKKAVLEGRNRVQSMALVHEKLYQSENISKINIKEYLEELAATLFRSYDVSEDRIKLSSKIEAVDLSIDATMQIGLIINELISNALKYAFPDNMNGTVSVSLSKDSNGHQLEISDDGIGIASPDDLKKSYGYRIVRSISRGLNGTIDLDHHKGTTFRLTFTS